jgi:signal peptidase II
VKGWRYVFLAGLSLCLIAADQGTKYWAATSLAEQRMERSRPACDEDGPIARRERYRPVRQVDVIEGMFTLRYVENCAGAFGILSDQDEAIRRPFFLAVTLAAVVFIVLLFRRLKPDQRLLMWALPFVLGGALGNLIDRIHLRYVIDFIDMYHASIGRWPTYNIADTAIVIGVGLILLDMIPMRRTHPAPRRAAAAERAEPAQASDASSSAGGGED